MLNRKPMASMCTMPARERPRERLREKGCGALGDAELIALLLGTGTGGENALDLARRILVELGGVERLVREGAGDLARINGLGEAKVSRIVAAIELGTRIVERRSTQERNRRFTCSADIWEAYRTRLVPLMQETFLAVGLNNRNEPIREEVVAKGSLNECTVEPREVFRPMISEAAARLVVLHNHPSGDPRPSPHDVALTRRLVKVGEIIGIPLVDHIVVGRKSYSSLRDLGLMG